MPNALPMLQIFFSNFLFAQTTGFIIARTILTNLVLGAISRKLAKRRDGAPPINVTIRGTVENRRIILGTRRAGGVLVFYGTSSTGGSTNDLLWYVIVLAGHQVDDISHMFVDSRFINNSDIDAGTGAVTAGQFSGKMWIYKHLGTQAQTVDTNIDSAFSAWTSDHRLRGCAYIVVKMKRDDNAYYQGAPQSISAVVDGALCYDPREVSHDQDDPSTWEFTRNPALHARWYLTGGSVVNDQSSRMIMYGLREPNSRIDDAYTIAAANICDELLFGDNAPPSGSQFRYLCDIEASCGEARREIMEAILATMAGTATKQAGKWCIYAGAYDSPLHDLNQDDLFGALEVQDTGTHTDRYNAVSATYIDADKQWIEQTTPYRTDSAYETQDGGERIPREIDLRAVTNGYQAQRLCEIELRKSRMMRTIKMVGALNLLKVAKNEVFTLTHPRYNWTDVIFRCHERQFDFNEEAGKVTITARQEDPAVYADLLTGDYTTGTSETDAFIYETPDPPTSLTTTTSAIDIIIRVGIPAAFQQGSVVQIWEYTSSTPFSSATKIVEATADTFIVRHRDTTTRYYWATIKNIRGEVSANYPATTGVAGTAEFVQTDDIEEYAATELYVISSATGVTYSNAV